ncbi:MAG: FAD-binding oxidoreductase [Candidatus Saccharimonas sp.]
MMRYLESLLTRVTMYALTFGTLTVLICQAAIMPFFNAVSFTPFELAASSAVFIGVSIGVSYLLARIYGLRSHISSAYITALILILLCTPTLDGITLLEYALIATIAQASKFVLAYKGRHIFNPAAIGIFIAGLLEVGYATWWIGSPTFVWAVAIAGFLVLYKTRELSLGATYVATSLVVLAIVGVSPLTALLSWPVLFFAGFMLSEPLTLPPKRWQRLMLAVVVALAASVPYSLGPLHSSPILALVIGNILAFALAFRERAGVQLFLKDIRALTPSVGEFVFTSRTPIAFTPGQYIELTLPHTRADMRGIRRAFSIVNAPGSNELRLGIKFYAPSSTFKQALRRLPEGTSVQTTGIHGDFVLPRNPSKKLLFVAGGIGITPFVSQVQAYGHQRDIMVLYFVRKPEDAAYVSELRASGATVHCFSAGPTTENDFAQAAILDAKLLASYVPDASTRYAYISGPPAMVASTKIFLRGRVKSIKTDYFSGY